MRKSLILLVVGLVPFSATALAADTLSPGIWTNTEDVYFAEEEGREKGEWAGIEVGEEGQWRWIDPYGASKSEWSSDPIPNLSTREAGGWQIGDTEVRRARPLSCWVAVRKHEPKPDGSEDWTFERGLSIFDQGGRILLEGGEIAPDVTIRVRNVTWAKGSNQKPVRVIYVHTNDMVRADSYSWSSPTSEIVGINLRWVQASCSETPTQIEGI